MHTQCHQNCVPARHTDVHIWNIIIATTQFFKDYLQEGKADKQLNCSGAHRLYGKICQIGYLQLIKLSGSENAPIRDE